MYRSQIHIAGECDAKECHKLANEDARTVFTSFRHLYAKKYKPYGNGDAGSPTQRASTAG